MIRNMRRHRGSYGNFRRLSTSLEQDEFHEAEFSEEERLLDDAVEELEELKRSVDLREVLSRNRLARKQQNRSSKLQKEINRDEVASYEDGGGVPDSKYDEFWRTSEAQLSSKDFRDLEYYAHYLGIKQIPFHERRSRSLERYREAYGRTSPSLESISDSEPSHSGLHGTQHRSQDRRDPCEIVGNQSRKKSSSPRLRRSRSPSTSSVERLRRLRSISLELERLDSNLGKIRELSRELSVNRNKSRSRSRSPRRRAGRRERSRSPRRTEIDRLRGRRPIERETTNQRAVRSRSRGDARTSQNRRWNSVRSRSKDRDARQRSRDTRREHRTRRPSQEGRRRQDEERRNPQMRHHSRDSRRKSRASPRRHEKREERSSISNPSRETAPNGSSGTISDKQHAELVDSFLEACRSKSKRPISSSLRGMDLAHSTQAMVSVPTAYGIQERPPVPEQFSSLNPVPFPLPDYRFSSPVVPDCSLPPPSYVGLLPPLDQPPPTLAMHGLQDRHMPLKAPVGMLSNVQQAPVEMLPNARQAPEELLSKVKQDVSTTESVDESKVPESERVVSEIMRILREEKSQKRSYHK